MKSEALHYREDLRPSRGLIKPWPTWSLSVPIHSLQVIGKRARNSLRIEMSMAFPLLSLPGRQEGGGTPSSTPKKSEGHPSASQSLKRSATEETQLSYRDLQGENGGFLGKYLSCVSVSFQVKKEQVPDFL